MAFQPIQLIINFLTSRSLRNDSNLYPTTPWLQRFRAWHNHGLGWFPFARRYLGNRFYFLFLGVLRCFSSPRWPPATMYSLQDDAVLTAPGCPIQKSPDQRMFSSSPKLIAAFHVFHLHLTPRHPPFALSSLATKSFVLTQISLNALMRTRYLRKFVKFFVALPHRSVDVAYYDSFPLRRASWIYSNFLW